MKAAFIPWDKNIKNNNIYIPKHENYIDSHIELKRAFQKNGDDINTIDVYDDLRDVDIFLFTVIDYKWLNKVIAAGLIHRCIYCSAEPAVVKPENCKEGYDKLKNVFPFFMTFNDELVDGVRFFKRNIPFCFRPNLGDVPFEQKKLLVNISGNKFSDHPDELYTERERVVTYFEENHPEHITLYGTNWDKKKHPSYLGMIDDKKDAYHTHKFALALENTKDLCGYVTEKMLDCFECGIVPIYWGAKDIESYIPKDCFIDYSKFENIEELYQYLISMSESEYNKYMDAIKRMLKSDVVDLFSGEAFYWYIKALENHVSKSKFEISSKSKLKLKILEIKTGFKEKAEMLRIKSIKKIKKILKMERE